MEKSRYMQDMDRFFTLPKMTALLLALLAWTGAWAQSNVSTFPVEVTFQGLINNGKYAYVINSINLGNTYSSEHNLQNNDWDFVRFFGDKEINIGNDDVPLTMIISGDFSFGTSMGDATAVKNSDLVFNSGSKYITAVSVSTYDGTPVSVESITGEGFSRTISMLTSTTFGKVTLTMATHTPFNRAATISGIEKTYLDDGVNHPVPIVTYKEFDDSTPVTLTEDVDYTVSYSVGSTSGTVTVTGIGQYTGSKSKDYNIRQLELGDFTKLGDGIYEIATKQDLDNLAKYVNNDNNCSGVTFRQTADIAYTYTAVTWDQTTSGHEGFYENNYIPIGGYGHSFQGHFDGQGYTVCGIRIHKSQQPGSHVAESIGLFGYVSDGGSVQNVVLRDANIHGSDNLGGIVGFLGSNGRVTDCLLYHVRVASEGPTENSNIVVGHVGGTDSGSHFRDCRIGYWTADDAYNNHLLNNIFTLTTAASVTASKTAGYSAVIDDVTYYAAGSTFTLSCTVPHPDDCMIAYIAQKTDGSEITSSNISGNLLTMPDADVTVSATTISKAPITLNGQLSDGVYWATYYNHYFRFILPEGAQAYTMGSDHKLYRLGDDGRTIPADVAVVILSDKQVITLTPDSGNSTITDNAPNGGNILLGNDSDVPVTSIAASSKKAVYVLSKDTNGDLGFRQYTRSGSIPAHKAYYVQHK